MAPLLPTLRHLPSCQVIDFRNNLMMVDCGEGAQLSMRRARLKYSRLSHIFLSHLHGDHCLGLPGLLSTLALTGKEGGTITIHTFKEGAAIFRRIMDFFCRETPFDIQYDIIAPGTDDVIWESDALEVRAFPLIHRVPTTGFIFKEKPKLRHIIGDAVAFHQVPVREMQAIKAGADFVKPDGTVIANERLTRPADPSMSYAYCPTPFSAKPWPVPSRGWMCCTTRPPTSTPSTRKPICVSTLQPPKPHGWRSLRV